MAHNHVYAIWGIAQCQNGIALKNFTINHTFGLKKQSNEKSFISGNANIWPKNVRPFKIEFKKVQI
jgi:hypothetical protein